MFINGSEYKEKLDNIVNSSIYGTNPARGMIYDRNSNILVDNKGVKTVYYKRVSGMSVFDEVNVAEKLLNVINIECKTTNSMLKDLWLVMNEESSKNKITDEEWNMFKIRKLSSSDIESLKRSRITDAELESVNPDVAYIYYLMHNGYSYEEKLILKGISDEEYAHLKELELDGIILKLSWDRSYIYGDTLRGIFGNVSDEDVGLTSDLLEYYREKGYSLNDRVGLSGLEFYYDEYLKGKKAEYKNVDGLLTLVKEEELGNDLYLTIDINLQLELERVVKEELIKAKKEPNTEYFNKAFVVISDPKTGDILALTAKMINNGVVYDYTSHILSSSFTVGSVIKGASISVGYKEGAIDIGTVFKDECIKLYATPTKCSWRDGLGNLSDIDALRLSSNSYQFKIAMKVAGSNYYYNMPFELKNDAFNIYRTMFNNYGLGVKTGIDLPNESVGIKGVNDTPGLLLDFSIGQYDTYTILGLIQYINTIANSGDRLKLNLLKGIKKESKVIYENKKEILNTIPLDDIYIDRIRQGFKSVLGRSGLGYGYIDINNNPAGKTGTAQSFYDSDKDGIIDKETITSTFAGFAPFDNPVMSIVSVTPDVSHVYGTNYTSSINKRIVRRITDIYLKNRH